jgi:hypothetical protein
MYGPPSFGFYKLMLIVQLEIASEAAQILYGSVDSDHFPLCVQRNRGTN